MNTSVKPKTSQDYLKWFASDTTSFPLSTLEKDLEFLYQISKTFLEKKKAYRKASNTNPSSQEERTKMKIIEAVCFNPKEENLIDLGLNPEEFLFLKYTPQHRLHLFAQFLQNEKEEEKKQIKQQSFSDVNELLKHLGTN